IIQIYFQGLNLVYDGQNLYDAGGGAGNNGNPAESDQLSYMEFDVSNGGPFVQVGTLTNNIFADIFIPVGAGLPTSGTVTGSGGGYFDLLTSAGGYGLALNINDW